MNEYLTKPPRGRPKTLDRDHVLEMAMNSYWKEGIDGISVNKICKLCNVSKPSLYREFGSEDGLVEAVLLFYVQNVQSKLLQKFDDELSFKDKLDSLISYITAEEKSVNSPKGCLIVKMLETRSYLGEASTKQLDLTQKKKLKIYKGWVKRAKANKEITGTMTSNFVSKYIDFQVNNSLSQIARGQKKSTVKEILKLALSVLA